MDTNIDNDIDIDIDIDIEIDIIKTEASIVNSVQLVSIEFKIEITIVVMNIRF